MSQLTTEPPLTDVRELLQVKPSVFIIRILLLFLISSLAVGGILHVNNLYALPFEVLLAMTMAHATELAHQCIHKTGTGNPLLDRAFGVVLCWPALVCFSHYRWFHLWHHKENGSFRDAESFGYTYAMMQHPSLRTRLTGFLRHVTMADHFANTFRRLYFAVTGGLAPALRSEMPQMSASAALQIQIEYRWMAFMLLVVVALAIFAWSATFRLWVIPLLLWAPIHAMIELPEHWATAPRPNENAFENTRTIHAGWFANWYTNANCYHVEHHEYSAIPMQRLTDLHTLLTERGIQFRYLERGYLNFYRAFFKSLWDGSERTSSS